jgi:hypothetical protein
MNLDDIKKKLDNNLTSKKPNSHLKKIGNEKVDRRHFNKRTPGTGRKKKEETLVKIGVKAWLDEHANEKVDIQVYDKSTGKTIIMKKPRIAYAMERLFQIGTERTASSSGNPSAIDLWLNRIWGRPSQPVRGEGADDPPIKLHVENLAEILRKAYGHEDTD